MTRLAERTGIDPRALLGFGLLAIGTLLWVLAFTGGLSSLFGSSTRTIRADFASIEDIVPNDPVRVHGVQVGTVASTSPDPRGAGATVTIDLTSNAPAIYNDASASIVWRTALGANDAIALDPGTRSAGLLGSRTLRRSQDANQVELDQITQAAFHGGAQAGIRTMLQQLAPALKERPRIISQDFSTLADIAPAATVGIGALRGEIPDTDLKNLVLDTSRAAQAVTVGTGGSETRQFVQSAAITLASVSANQPALRASIVGLGQVLNHVRVTTPEINQTLTELSPLVAKLTDDTPPLAPTLTILSPAVINLDTLLEDATPLLRKLRPTVGSLADTADVGVPVIRSLSPSLQRLQRTILPGLAEKGPEEGGHPSYDMLGAAFVGLGSLAGVFDPDGRLDHLTVDIAVGSAQGAQILPCTEDFSGEDFLVCNSLSQALGTLFTGGTSLLQSLARRPGGESIYGPLIGKAQTIANRFATAQHALTAKVPKLANWLFGPNHGGTN